MSRISGDLVTCSRCGQTIFLKKLGYSPSGGYRPHDDIEKLPDDWLNIVELGGHLCPSCSLMFKRMIEKFMDGVDIPPAWKLSPEVR